MISYSTLKQRKPLSRVSKKPHRRAKRFVPKSIIKQVKERSGGICEFKWFDGVRCGCDSANQPHHLLKRSQGGKHTLENLRDSCWYHNNYAEIEPETCKLLGWVIPYEGYEL